MHARYYSPWEHRFLSVDPIGGDPRQPQSWNAFSYVLNNPMNLVDPYGMIYWDPSRGMGVTEAEIQVIGQEPEWYRNLMMQRAIQRDFLETQAYKERTRTDETTRMMLSVAGGVMPPDFEDNFLTEYIADHFSVEASGVIGGPYRMGIEGAIVMDRTGLHGTLSVLPGVVGRSAFLGVVGVWGPGRAGDGSFYSFGPTMGCGYGGGFDLVNYGGKNNQQIRFKLGLATGGSARLRLGGGVVPWTLNLF